MDERQDIQPNDKNIAQLMVKLATVQAQIKLVKAAIFLNKQKEAVNSKIKSFKEYAEGQAEKYSQNMEEANKVIDEYKSAVEEAMQQYKDNYLEVMAEQDEWQNMEIDKMGEQKEISSAIKEKRKSPEYTEWEKAVKNLNREIIASANDPEKLTALAAELKELQSKDPTLQEQQRLENIKNDRLEISEIIQDNDVSLAKIKEDRDSKLSDLLESKETSLAKIQKQTLWQKIVAKLTPKAKSFKNNVVDKISEKTNKIKTEKIPAIIKEINEKKEKNVKIMQEKLSKIPDLASKVKGKLDDAKKFTVKSAKTGVRTVVDFGREDKKTTIGAIKGIGTKVSDTKDKIKQDLMTAVENSSHTLDDLNESR